MDLDELERLLKAATAGPWENYGMFPHCFEVCMAGDYATKPVCASPRKANADAIVALRNSAEELIRDARRMQWIEERAVVIEALNKDETSYARIYYDESRPLRAAIDAAIAQEGNG